MFILITKCQPTSILRPQTTSKIFTRHTNNDKCNTWGIEATAIPRRVKVKHIKGKAIVLADSVSMLRAVGFYHDIDLKDHQQEFSMPSEPLPPFEPASHTPLEVDEVFIATNIGTLVQTYDTLHDLPTGQTNDDVKLSLENVLSTDIPQSEQNLMSLSELTPEKVTTVQKNDIFCKNIIQHIDCSKSNNYFIDVKASYIRR